VEVPFLPESPVIGQIVISKAGRDSGKSFVVTRVLDETTVMVADGDMRTVEKPKKKNIRHLELTRIVKENIMGKVSAGALTNAVLKEALDVRYEDDIG
jgi:large subunit ribosomal protein L14e